ncbi:hypothetical protein GR11A_00130 [Vibrio phage vB_VcorM_GR11A]|nr:hypothetical protein GR11A_00130 [Vibrio phage vB_VcorM_GR11A]
MAFTEDLTWLADGEPGSGSTQSPAESDGVLNRPLKQLLDNDLELRSIIQGALGITTQTPGASADSPITLANNAQANITVDGPIVLNTPANPVDGQPFKIKMVGGAITDTNTVTLVADTSVVGGARVSGRTSLPITQDNFDLTYTYDSGTTNWVLTDSASASTGIGLSLDAIENKSTSGLVAKNTVVALNTLATMTTANFGTKYNTTWRLKTDAERVQFTLPTIYFDTNGVVDPTHLQWQDTATGNLWIARHPEDGRWMMWDTTDSSGAGGWYIQRGTTYKKSPAHVTEWEYYTRAVTTPPVGFDNNGVVVNHGLDITLPTDLAEGDSVMLVDIYDITGRYPVDFFPNGNLVDGSSDNRQLKADGQVIELQYFEGYGLKTIRGTNSSDFSNILDVESLREYAQSENDMEQMRESNQDQFAASQWVHYGKSAPNTSTRISINEGLHSDLTLPNWLLVGYPTSDGVGQSITNFPESHVAGFRTHIQGLGTATGSNVIKFPVAPKGTAVADSAGSVRNSGSAYLDFEVDEDPKWGNVATTRNEAAARAHEGFCRNGDFRDGTSHWGVGGSAGITVNSDGNLEATFSTNYSDVRQAGVSTFSALTGQVIEIEVVVLSNTVGSTSSVIVDEAGGVIGQVIATYESSDVYPKIVKGSITLTTDNPNLNVVIGSATGSAGTMVFGNVSFRRSTERVVTRRHDVFGGEYFLEEITTNNRFVYPYGMIQSKITEYAGIPTVEDTTRPITYFEAYPSDTTSRGQGFDFFNLSRENQIKLLQDRSMNLFILNDGRLVQWRMRQRTIAGPGNGKWLSIDPSGDQGLVFGINNAHIAPQGAFDAPQPLRGGTYYTSLPFEELTQAGVLTNGVFGSRNISDNEGVAVNGHCYFQVWGHVLRLNQGAYHPSFNPMGTANANSNHTGVNGDKWYVDEALILPSEAACFHGVTASSDTTTPGYAIGTGALSQVSGRNDGHYYDVIYPEGWGGVIDLRKPARDMSDVKEAAVVRSKVEERTYRGLQHPVRSKVFPQKLYAGSSNTGNMSVTTDSANLVASKLHEQGWDQNTRIKIWDKTDNLIYWGTISPNNGHIRIGQTRRRYFGTGIHNHTFANSIRNNELYIIAEEDMDVEVSGTYMVTDVIALPEQIVANHYLNQGFEGYFNVGLPTSSSQNYELSRKYLTTPEVYRQFTTNAGTTWSGDNTTIDSTVTNSLNNRNIPVGTTWVLQYNAWAKPTKPATMKSILGGTAGIVPDMRFLNFYYELQGSLLQESLTDHIHTVNQPARSTQSVEIRKFYFNPQSQRIEDFQGGIPSIEHGPNTLGPMSNGDYSVGYISHAVSNNGEVNMAMLFKEMRYGNVGYTTVTDQTNITAGPNRLLRFTGNGTLQGKLIYNRTNNLTGVSFGDSMVNGSFLFNSSSTGTNSHSTYIALDDHLPEWGDFGPMFRTNNRSVMANMYGYDVHYGTHELAIGYGYTHRQPNAGSTTGGVDQ